MSSQCPSQHVETAHSDMPNLLISNGLTLSSHSVQITCLPMSSSNVPNNTSQTELPSKNISETPFIVGENVKTK